MKRLSQPTGAISHQGPQEGDQEDRVVRPAVLVHAGAEGQPIEFQSGDGPIQFDAARIKNIVEVHNAKLDRLAAEYGGEEKIPIGAYEPILDQHENDSTDRVIGRLTGHLKYEVRDVPKVGKNVPCAVADPGITFLGKENVARVKDGRIYHLSIGINEEDDTLGETSSVIKPAAPGAMLLKQGKGEKTQTKPPIGGNQMSQKLKRLEQHEEKLRKLSAMKESLSGMTTKLGSASSVVKLQARKGEITHRLNQAMRSGKMTPAEFKNLSKDDGLTKLAKLDDSTLNVALSAFEAREKPVIQPGQIGSTASPDVSEITQNLERSQFKRLKSEIASDFKRLSGKQMNSVEKEDPEHKLSGPKETEINPGKDPHSVPGQAGDEEQLKAMVHKHMGELGKHLAAGDLEEAKKSHEALMKHMGSHGMKHMAEYTGDVKSEDYKKGMDELQHQVDELSTQLSRMGGMVEELMSAEQEEGHALKARLKKELEGKDEPGEGAAPGEVAAK